MQKQPSIRFSDQSKGDYSAALIEFSKAAFMESTREWSYAQRHEHNRLALSTNPADRVRAILIVVEAIQVSES